jgi:hypothetical protein
MRTLLSNSQRIWRSYFAIALFLAMPLWLPPILLQLSQLFPIDIGVAYATCFIVLGGGMFLMRSDSGGCWRCGTALTKTPGGWYSPIVFWRRCGKCGTAHAAKPDYDSL